ncbi:hypothetical protein WM03_11975 [Burkholderia ubonensis]|nr:hypothetical protein WJ65_19845 [Burkholderia ubonensis]KVP10125.1 hypothetical protein WJ84_23705 [Burkholderia ubonensis]KWI23634.1 hypothetical protein WM02_29235 [Burkholderia ubonensis]KWI31429.1 hypothetical protein WM03_11975 [Burkholderia ubonensis]ODQ24023.1 hypothetical protein BGV63_29435 [Burkholderia ubonensis]
MDAEFGAFAALGLSAFAGARLEEYGYLAVKRLSEVLQINHHWAGRFVLQPADVGAKSMRFDRECFLTQPCLTAQPFHVCYYSGRGVFAGRLLFFDRSVAKEVDDVDIEHIR